MAQRFALTLSVGITAFILVVIGTVIGIGRGAQAAATGSALDPQILAQLQTREAEYQSVIGQANELLRTETPTATATPVATPEPTSAFPVSSEMAAFIALSAAPNATLVKPPELVVFQGTVAYEVTLTSGLVYVDANTGAILWNGAVQNSGGLRNRGGDDESGSDD